MMAWEAMIPKLHDQVMAPLVEVEGNMVAAFRRRVEVSENFIQSTFPVTVVPIDVGRVGGGVVVVDW